MPIFGLHRTISKWRLEERNSGKFTAGTGANKGLRINFILSLLVEIKSHSMHLEPAAVRQR